MKRSVTRLFPVGLDVWTSTALTCAVLLIASAYTARAAGVVGTGTAASCTDAALNTALTGGGLVTFNCGGGPVTIDISPGAGGTGTKSIAVDTTIDGGGVVTISGGNSVGVFSVNTGVNFTVQNLTIANGNSAGSGDGGGIFNGGTLTVTNSTFSANSAGDGSGGGIFNNVGTVTVTNSTFSGNRADNGMGGGGIFNNSSTLTVTNSTFFGNRATNGGAIYNSGTMLTVTNSIVANSTSGGNCSGTITDDGHNIDDGTTCGFSGTSLSNTNPMLAPAGLANNGGPTQTIALQATSPAINAGDKSVCAAPPVNHLDQRGFERPGIGHTSCSIGAYEADAIAPCVVGTGTTASCTESALDACLPRGASFNGAVTFNCGDAATITVTSTKTISADTTIDGGSLITISGGNSVGVFSVSTGVAFTVQNLTIANGN
ncbi:MAG: choice-of-anchor Q domain-containing protein [Candidatus Binatia bacterium]